MIYTCYEMIRDCRGGKPEGWVYFIAHYVPAVRRLLERYATGDAALLARVLEAVRARLFERLEPVAERQFVAQLRQCVLGELEPPPPASEIDLETLAAALQPLTVVEKEAAWLETMRYGVGATAELLRLSAGTVEAVRGRAAELVRGAVDTWSAGMLAENGLALGRAAAAAAGTACLSPKAIVDVLDGRAAWRAREEVERHLAGCWHCVDHFCRMLEAGEVVRGIQPPSGEEARVYRNLLGVDEPARPLWKRWVHLGK